MTNNSQQAQSTDPAPESNPEVRSLDPAIVSFPGSGSKPGEAGSSTDLPPPNSEPLTAASAERFRAVGTNYTVQSKELLTTVKIIVPGKETFIRTHPDPGMEFITHSFETRDGHSLIEPPAFDAIRAKVPDFHKFAPCVSLRPYITKYGTINLWPLKRESPFSIGGNSYNVSAFNASDRSRGQWVRVSSNQDRGEWIAYEPDEFIPEPKWPENLTMLMLIDLAAKGGVIDGPDHILIRPLRGKA
jgi:hypothetical protein